jgi:hypothetical protein
MEKIFDSTVDEYCMGLRETWVVCTTAPMKYFEELERFAGLSLNYE